MVRIVRRTFWDNSVEELERRLTDLDWMSEITSKQVVEDYARKLQAVIVQSYETACPLRKVRSRDGKNWWNAELTRLRKEARLANRKAMKTESQEEWEAKKLAQRRFKNAIRKAKRESWRSFTESLESQAPTARLVKALQRDKTAQLSNVYDPNGVLTDTPKETLNCLLDILSPGSMQADTQQLSGAVESVPNLINESLLTAICSEDRLKEAVEGFKPFKSPGKDGIYPILLQKGWETVKNTTVLSSVDLRCGYVPMEWKEGIGVFLLNQEETHIKM